MDQEHEKNFLNALRYLPHREQLLVMNRVNGIKIENYEDIFTARELSKIKNKKDRERILNHANIDKGKRSQRLTKKQNFLKEYNYDPIVNEKHFKFVNRGETITMIIENLHIEEFFKLANEYFVKNGDTESSYGKRVREQQESCIIEAVPGIN